MNAVNMSSKEIIKDLLLRLYVRQGMSELDREKNVTIEPIEQELPSWIMRYAVIVSPP